jgi:hypothetical protein
LQFVIEMVMVMELELILWKKMTLILLRIRVNYRSITMHLLPRMRMHPWMRSMIIFMMYLLLIRHKNPYTKTQRQVFSLLFIVGQLKGIEWYFKHMYDTNPKDGNIILYLNISFYIFFVIVII